MENWYEPLWGSMQTLNGQHCAQPRLTNWINHIGNEALYLSLSLSHSLGNYINVECIRGFNHVKAVKRSHRSKCARWQISETQAH